MTSLHLITSPREYVTTMTHNSDYLQSCKTNKPSWKKADRSFHTLENGDKLFNVYYDNGKLCVQRWYQKSAKIESNDLHRLDGPAYISYYENGMYYRSSWWINGNSISGKVMRSWLKENNISSPYSDEDQMAIILRWG